MTPLDDARVRASFANCSQGEAKRLRLPVGLSASPWDELDYLGWRDPQAPGRAYLVAERAGAPVGLVLRVPISGLGARPSMCSLCLTVPEAGVSLMVAPKAGRAGQRGHSVGTYICADLACSRAVRGKAPAGRVVQETLTVEQKVERLVANLDAFVARALRGG